MTDQILVIGGKGILGKIISEYFAENQYSVRVSVRFLPATKTPNIEYVETGDLGEFEGWPKLFENVGVVIFAAGMAHVDPSKVCNDVAINQNAAVPAKIAEFAKVYGVSKFIFLSSIKVNGSETSGQEMFKESDDAKPSDIYGRSKLKAENLLAQLVSSKFSCISLRIPLVISPNAKGNIGLFRKIIKARIPVPIGALNKNRRSVLFSQELCVLIKKLIVSQEIGSKTLLVRHPVLLSTLEIYQSVAKIENIRPIVFSIPFWIISAVLHLHPFRRGRSQMIGDLVIEPNFHIPNEYGDD